MNYKQLCAEICASMNIFQPTYQHLGTIKELCESDIVIYKYDPQTYKLYVGISDTIRDDGVLLDAEGIADRTSYALKHSFPMIRFMWKKI